MHDCNYACTCKCVFYCVLCFSPRARAQLPTCCRMRLRGTGARAPATFANIKVWFIHSNTTFYLHNNLCKTLRFVSRFYKVLSRNVSSRQKFIKQRTRFNKINLFVWHFYTQTRVSKTHKKLKINLNGLRFLFTLLGFGLYIFYHTNNISFFVYFSSIH